jgi:hypothetical protein
LPKLWQNQGKNEKKLSFAKPNFISNLLISHHFILVRPLNIFFNPNDVKSRSAGAGFPVINTGQASLLPVLAVLKKREANRIVPPHNYFLNGAPGRIRTCDLRIRSPALCPG